MEIPAAALRRLYGLFFEHTGHTGAYAFSAQGVRHHQNPGRALFHLSLHHSNDHRSLQRQHSGQNRLPHQPAFRRLQHGNSHAGPRHHAGIRVDTDAGSSDRPGIQHHHTGRKQSGDDESKALTPGCVYGNYAFRQRCRWICRRHITAGAGRFYRLEIFHHDLRSCGGWTGPYHLTNTQSGKWS